MITALVYRDSRLVDSNPSLATLAELRQQRNTLLWVDLSEPTPEETRIILEELFRFHPLTIEECQNESRFPKWENYGEFIYLVMHAVDFVRENGFATLELDLFLGRDFLVTFHTRPLKPVQTTLERCLKNPALPIRGPDRLLHTILDLMVETYRPVTAQIRSEIEELEESVLSDQKKNLNARLIAVRKDLSKLRQTVRPQRELIGELAQGKTGFFRPTLLPYLRDLHDEFIRMEEFAAAGAEQVMVSFRIYLNRIAHESNRGIRVLTALNIVALPLILIGTWYSMNFRALPHLRSPGAYFTALGVMVVCTALTYAYLKRRRWF